MNCISKIKLVSLLVFVFCVPAFAAPTVRLVSSKVNDAIGRRITIVVMTAATNETTLGADTEIPETHVLYKFMEDLREDRKLFREVLTAAYYEIPFASLGKAFTSFGSIDRWFDSNYQEEEDYIKGEEKDYYYVKMFSSDPKLDLNETSQFELIGWLAFENAWKSFKEEWFTEHTTMPRLKDSIYGRQMVLKPEYQDKKLGTMLAFSIQSVISTTKNLFCITRNVNQNAVNKYLGKGFRSSYMHEGYDTSLYSGFVWSGTPENLDGWIIK